MRFNARCNEVTAPVNFLVVPLEKHRRRITISMPWGRVFLLQRVNAITADPAACGSDLLTHNNGLI